MKNTPKMSPIVLAQAWKSCRAMWFAAGQPMDRNTSALRRRYVKLYNMMAERNRI